MKKVKISLLVFIAVMGIAVSGCSQKEILKCIEEHPGCRWNCEAQHSFATDWILENAANERSCHW